MNCVLVESLMKNDHLIFTKLVKKLKEKYPSTISNYNLKYPIISNVTVF